MNMVMTAIFAPFHDLSTPPASQKSKIRSYCKAHPLDTYKDAVLDLFDSLPEIPDPAKKK
jgi:hypothetical protein